MQIMTYGKNNYFKKANIVHFFILDIAKIKQTIYLCKVTLTYTKMKKIMEPFTINDFFNEQNEITNINEEAYHI